MPDTPSPAPAVLATGLGSWPGSEVREALRVVTGELAGQTPEGVTGMPYLPELPARGPGADMLGRTAHLLVDLPVDLQARGWRLVDRPGRDQERTASWWRQDLDELAEALDGWAGPLKVQVAGPWTLAATLWLPLGDRVLSDPGATRDLASSLAEGVKEHVEHVRGLVPGAEVVLQVDEPLLPAVLLGRVRSDSGYRVLRTPERGEVVAALEEVVRGCGTVLHCCATDPPVDVLAQAGAAALSLDLAGLGRGTWEQVATAVESGTALWAGVLPTSGTAPTPEEALEPLLRAWRELGLPRRALTGVGITPACGLAGATPEEARGATTATVRTALRLAEVAAG